MIEINGLTKTFGRATVVDAVSLAIHAGEAVALWGENGAGKTTIIRCVLGLLRYRGTIRVAGLDAWRDGKRARQLVGYVPQELGFYDDLRVHEAVRFFGKLKGLRVNDVDEALARVGLAGHGGKSIRQLSGGMKQRLALSIALLGDPPVLVLDEVTASLDACGRAEFIELLASLTKSDGRATLFASHRVEEIDALASRVVTLERGRVTSDVTAADFVRRAAARNVLHVFLHGDRVDDALETLRASGIAAHRNGRGIFIAAEPAARAAALHRLEQADIRVEDFEIVPAAAAKETTP
jgi:ABC-type multidrug transport system ATPase subunit